MKVRYFYGIARGSMRSASLVPVHDVEVQTSGPTAEYAFRALCGVVVWSPQPTAPLGRPCRNCATLRRRKVRAAMAKLAEIAENRKPESVGGAA